MFLKPDKFVKSYLDITPETIRSMQSDTIFVDLDGTLVSKDTKEPTSAVIDWINSFVADNIQVVILSNNQESRVHAFCKDLSVPYFHLAKKPLQGGFKKAFAAVSTKKSKVVMIGDQIYTDTLGARIFGAKSIYVKPIDQHTPYVKFRTNFTEKPFLKFEENN